MKILMLCQRLPYPPTKGEKIRAFHHLRGLARNHEVTLICQVDDRADRAHVERLRTFATAVETIRIRPRWAKLKTLAAVPGRAPLTLRYFFAPGFLARVNAHVGSGRYDLIFVYSSGMAQYVEHVGHVPIVVDFVDIDSRKWAQYAAHAGFPLNLLYRTEARRMGAYEGRIGRMANASLFVSRAEAELFSRSVPEARTVAVPMAVDTEYFQPIRPTGAEPPPTLIFTGVMDYLPNVDAVRYFARHIYPRVREAEPAARFRIVGQRPSRPVRRLARIPGIEVTGPVADVRPYFAEARVAVAPLRLAQGMQTKILEAMAMGVPVVATSKAYAGLEAAPGEHLIVEDEPARFADAVAHLLRSPDRRSQLGLAGREFVEIHHSFATSIAQLDRVLATVAAPRAAGAFASAQS